MKNETTETISCATLTLFALIFLTGPAQADDLENRIPHSDGPACLADTNNPHWSKGGGTVLFKTRVQCNWDVTVDMSGELGFVSGGSSGSPTAGPPEIVATSSETREVRAYNSETFYTPIQGDEKVTGAGTYTAQASGQVVSPSGTAIDVSQEKRAYVSSP